jgi:hypothetical protein
MHGLSPAHRREILDSIASPASPASPAGTIQTNAGDTAIPASTHEADAGHLPYADPHALQACRARRKRPHRTDITAPTWSEPLHADSVETEEGWKLVERKRWKGKRVKKVGPAGGAPTWVYIVRGGDVRVTVFIGVGAGYTMSKAHRPA